MVKIIQDYDRCIGCGSCAAICQKFWEMDYDNNKVNLRGAKRNKATGEYELEVENIECNQEASNICPVQVIKIIKD